MQNKCESNTEMILVGILFVDVVRKLFMVEIWVGFWVCGEFHSLWVLNKIVFSRVKEEKMCSWSDYLKSCSTLSSIIVCQYHDHCSSEILEKERKHPNLQKPVCFWIKIQKCLCQVGEVQLWMQFFNFLMVK